jgi:hypothetical protein
MLLKELYHIWYYTPTNFIRKHSIGSIVDILEKYHDIYAIFFTDYKKILKIAGGMKQLTVFLLPGPNCSMPENAAQFVGQTRWQIGLKM